MNKNFSWKIWGKKVIVTTIAVALAGGVSVWQNNPYWLSLVPVLKAVENYYKHA